MRFERCREVLDHTARFHRHLADLYHRLEGRASDQRVRMLLGYLSQREKDMAAAMDRFLEETPDPVLDTWFSHAHDDESLVCPEPQLPPEMSVGDVLGVATDLHLACLDAFRGIANKADSEEVRGVFRNLIAHTEKDWQKLVRNVGQISDF
jgi:hypothetical protein